MKAFLIITVCYLFICSISKQDKVNIPQNKLSPDSLLKYCSNFNFLNNKIRDNKISKKEALNQIQYLLPKIKAAYYKNGGKDFPQPIWRFPIEGYGTKAIGGVRGNGYVASKYNYFDGNKHLGHPAHDIFITDKNQDCIDDRTNKPANILSITGGIVLATDSGWDSTSSLRGGNYIWIYDPYSNSFYYYAHNSALFVKPGDIIKPGNIIATVGRTGLNAYKKRSPTHLHIMQLKLDNYIFPKPVNCYGVLIKAIKLN